MISKPPSVSHAEWIWLAVAIVIGAALRLGNLSEVAVEHFDEAVYASNLLFPADQGGEYPFRQLYAPPLLPAVIEWTTIFGQLLFGGVPAWWPMLPALVAGLATIPSAWWIVRQWFSPRAGIIAAILIASHEFHAAYCRTALTDVPLTLFILWSVHRFWIALQTGTTRDAMIAGAITSLAWWTKYNGWLPLAIAASGGVLWQIVTPPTERNWSRLAKVWLIAVVTACVLWLPVLRDAQKIGGYSKIAENHRGYVTGLSRWSTNLVAGYQSFDEFVNWLSFAGLCIAGIVFVVPRRSDGIDSKDVVRRDDLLALCLISAWFMGLLAATPMYHPYSRLWLPWLASSVLVIAAAAPVRNRVPSALPARLLRRCFIIIAATCGLMYAGAALSNRSSVEVPASWDRRADMEFAARQTLQIVGDKNPIFIVGSSDPALWYHLTRMHQPAISSSSLDVADGRSTQPRYLVLGPQSQRDPSMQRDLEQRQARLESVGDIPIQLSRIAAMDLFSPAELAAHPELRTQSVKLYRVRR